ncbi:AAA family ATPase, partial [Ligilactobacillus agilis]|uniref:AAA family ATPase n=1 Tax=Ligilactobacillus agilis TaxID=1601 RepID=UPI003F8BD15B
EVLNRNGLKIDKQNKNPSRLTRLPGFVRGNKKQFLVATNIGKANWDEWTEYIEDLNDNLPEMESLENLFDEEIVLAPELISGVLRKGHKMLIAGPSKAGKSFALIQLAIAIAEGRQWFGFNCMQGKVLYVNLELDGKSAKKRFVDI